MVSYALRGKYSQSFRIFIRPRAAGIFPFHLEGGPHVDPESDLDDFDSVVDRANVIETRFAIEHPRAERFLREIIDALSRVGI